MPRETGTTELFAGLPNQRPPGAVRAGRFLLEHSPACRGSGRHRFSALSGGYQPERFSEPCAKCDGGGKRLVKARGRKR